MSIYRRLVVVMKPRVKIIALDPTHLRKQTKYNMQRNYPPPPTSPFLQRSATSTPVDHTYNPNPSSDHQHPYAPDDSGYHSVFSNTSTNGRQDRLCL